jgi:SET and MYND domain-containing protein
MILEEKYLVNFHELADSTRELAITVANRSATFYHLEKYQLALQDIALVLSLDYPLEFHYKVLER